MYAPLLTTMPTIGVYDQLKLLDRPQAGWQAGRQTESNALRRRASARRSHRHFKVPLSTRRCCVRRDLGLDRLSFGPMQAGEERGGAAATVAAAIRTD